MLLASSILTGGHSNAFAPTERGQAVNLVRLPLTFEDGQSSIAEVRPEVLLGFTSHKMDTPSLHEGAAGSGHRTTLHILGSTGRFR